VGDLDPASAALAAGRWLVSVFSIVLIGQVGARVVCVRAFPAGGLPHSGNLPERRQARLAAICCGLLGVSLVALLAAQIYSWFRFSSLTLRDQVVVILTQSGWGAAWRNAALVVLLMCVVSALARRRGARFPLSLLRTAGIAVTIPLLGHANGESRTIWMMHAGHLLGAGLWIGTLIVLLLTTWRDWTVWSGSASVLPSLLKYFSPVALAGAGLLTATGVFIAWDHLRPLATVWQTEFGRTLTIKLVGFVVVAGLGLANWRRLGPRIGTGSSPVRLRRVALVEAVFAVTIVLGLTAWLGGLPTPGGH
jgi:putative copper export protein